VAGGIAGYIWRVTTSTAHEVDAAPAAVARHQVPQPGRVAVIAHKGKTLGGGLDELRTLVTAERVDEVIWYEVAKSSKAPAKVRKALKQGADLLFVWGGDGMVQQCADALVGSDSTIAIIPAGTANLLAHNLGIPHDLAEAVRIGFHGQRRRLDLGRINGEHFAVMAGVGLDADMIRDADGGLKTRLGRLAYLWTGLRNIGAPPTEVKIKIDGTTWFNGDATCVLIGNVGTILGGVQVFDDARPDDGWLDIGVCTADGAVQWARALGHISTGNADRSPFIRTTRAKRISVKLSAPLAYELDGGARPKTRRIKAKVVPAAITVRVPGP
jgi:YegS/Rv2252/BmrU family lipid kinase